jgi:hypothetical protein
MKSNTSKTLSATVFLLLITGTALPSAFAANGINNGDVGSNTLAGSLAPFYTATLPGGGHVADGVGLTTSTTGAITITLPAGATVEKAFLYWNVMVEDIPSVTLNAIPVAGTNIGIVPETPCWGPGVTNAYRADVTSLVTGSGVYTVGLAASNQNNALGAALVVVYKDALSPFDTLVRIDDGHIMRNFFEVMSHTMTGLSVPPSGALSAKTTYVVGDGQGAIVPTSAKFEAVVQSTNIAAASDGERWDTTSFDVTALLPPGTTDADVTIEASGDCLTWVAQVLDISFERLVVGGESLPLNTMALFVSGISSSGLWMIPALAGIVGTGFYLTKFRKN